MRDRSGDVADALYVQLSTFFSYWEVGEERENGSSIAADVLSPEQDLIRRDLFTNLRKDTRWLISTICNRPEELSTPATGQLTQVSITIALKRKKWNRNKIEQSFKEIQKFLAEAYSF
jgi:hypothetical protein